MTRTTVPLTLDLLAELDPPCGRHGARSRDRRLWVSERLREWGSCGRVALVEGHPVGLVVYGPPESIPEARRQPTAPVSEDAVLMAAVWLDPEHRAGGLGRLLVQGMAADLVHRPGVRAIECFARRGADRSVHRELLVPAGFLARVGFRTQRQHPRVPRMRMDLRSTLTWRDEVGATWERLREAVRPSPVTSPVGTRVGGGAGIRQADGPVTLAGSPAR
ncbi:GNAT family N-acetyltransferase [Nocardioides sp. YIM 152588]|uniref:GNAT family N-acetyltransferase n=1 Tax=Nocardioides sp. YIM 152588 TaxID=3158259 RepID=UPI0032E42E20